MKKITSIRTVLLGTIAGAVGLMAFANSSQASHDSFFSSIDAIDNVFASGGGVFSGTLANGTEDAWLVFAANAGDVLNISIDVGTFKNAVLLQDTEDGNFAVGDDLNVLNFNVDHTGDGEDLTILAHIGALEFNSNGSLIFNALFTGQYGIAINAPNESNRFAGDYMVTLSGNSANIGPVSAVPLPAALPLFVGGLGLMGFLSRRKKQQT